MLSSGTKAGCGSLFSNTWEDHMDREQDRRERADNIWEDERRVDGKSADRRARTEGQHAQGTDDVTRANEKANEQFAGEDGRKERDATDRPPSTVNPD